MAEGKKSWMPNWGLWKQRLQRLVFGVLAIALVAGLVWWFWFRGTGSPPVYDVYSTTNYVGEDRDATAAEIQTYLTENFPPDRYEYLGIIAQRHPSAQSSSTTTYVLFKRK